MVFVIYTDNVLVKKSACFWMLEVVRNLGVGEILGT
jgi:hypothetical protein